MKIKKRPLISIIATTLLIVMLCTATTFSGTYAWFVKQAKPVDLTGTMGKVEVSVAETTPGTVIVTNNSNIPIIVRVRVIAEVANPITMSPPLAPTPSLGWVSSVAQNGLFFVYGTSGSSFGGYTTVQPRVSPTFTYEPISGVTYTFIAEALQATSTAYTYTTAANPPTGVTSWALN